jgi:hypothetical protein
LSPAVFGDCGCEGGGLPFAAACGKLNGDGATTCGAAPDGYTGWVAAEGVDVALELADVSLFNVMRR